MFVSICVEIFLIIFDYVDVVIENNIINGFNMINVGYICIVEILELLVEFLNCDFYNLEYEFYI